MDCAGASKRNFDVFKEDAGIIVTECSTSVE